MISLYVFVIEIRKMNGFNFAGRSQVIMSHWRNSLIKK